MSWSFLSSLHLRSTYKVKVSIDVSGLLVTNIKGCGERDLVKSPWRTGGQYSGVGQVGVGDRERHMPKVKTSRVEACGSEPLGHVFPICLFPKADSCTQNSKWSLAGATPLVENSFPFFAALGCW